jgi:hypothetical protein
MTSFSHWCTCTLSTIDVEITRGIGRRRWQRCRQLKHKNISILSNNHEKFTNRRWRHRSWRNRRWRNGSRRNRSWRNWSAIDDQSIRNTAKLQTGQIHTLEALAWVEQALATTREPISSMCALLFNTTSSTTTIKTYNSFANAIKRQTIGTIGGGIRGPTIESMRRAFATGRQGSR